MRLAIAALGLLLAACGGGGNNAPAANTANAPVHDHIHSHAGTDNMLPEVTIGPWKLHANVKDGVKRDALTYVELHFAGPSDGMKFNASVEGDDGTVVIQSVTQHRMEGEGKYALHLHVPQDAPAKLILRIDATRGDESFSGSVPLP